ncbi:sulfotransferase [Spirillospora sp. NPDC049652]
MGPFPAPGDADRTPGGSGEHERFRDVVTPHLKQMLDVSSPHAYEDAKLLCLSFASALLEGRTLMPEYRDWQQGTDQLFAYRYLRTTLQALTWLRGGERWLLKSPQHAEHLPALKAVFPDATVVFTHRDPVKVTASLPMLRAYTMRRTLHPIDLRAVGRYWTQRTERFLERLLEHRALFPAEQSIDVDPARLRQRVSAYADHFGTRLEPCQ